MQLSDFLRSITTEEVADSLSQTYDEIVKNYVLQKWKNAGLDAGHFVEAARRFVEFKLFRQATPVGKSLPQFNEKALQSYLDASGDEAYRILIPRLLWALYALRNKRSIGHLGAVPASEIDASVLLSGAKWVLSEIVRLESDLSITETRELVRSIIDRQELILWQEGSITRVLDQSLTASQRVLVILSLAGEKSEAQLRTDVVYKNSSNFRGLLKKLDAKNLVHFSADRCVISPTGTLEAERIIEESSSLNS